MTTKEATEYLHRRAKVMRILGLVAGTKKRLTECQKKAAWYDNRAAVLERMSKRKARYETAEDKPLEVLERMGILSNTGMEWV